MARQLVPLLIRYRGEVELLGSPMASASTTVTKLIR
jgi:hypothetical protein